MEDPNKINDYVLKLSGKVSLLEPIENDRQYNIAIKGEVVSKTEKPNQDGTYDIIYKFQPKVVEILKDAGKVIKSKDNRRNSQKLRAMIHFRWEHSNSELDSEEYYDRFMKKLMANFEGVVEYLNHV